MALNNLTVAPFPYGSLGLPSSASLATCVFTAASSGHAFDTPAGTRNVLFSATCDFYAAYGTTAATVPSSDTTAGSSAFGPVELNPTIRHLTTASTGFSLVTSATAGVVTMAFYGPA